MTRKATSVLLSLSIAATISCTTPFVFADTVPNSAPAGTTWTVKSGDTLWKIAQATGVSMSDIVLENNVSNPDMIFVGQVLVIPTAAEIKQNHVIQTAEALQGIQYAWGGVSPSTGFDCSGFTDYVFAQNGITLPRNSLNQFSVGTWVPASQLTKGDVVFFQNTYRSGISHVGIYIGNDMFIQASESKGVVISHLFQNSYYTAHYAGARRVIQ